MTYNGNPFNDNTQIIYESHPLDAPIQSEASAIEIRADFSAGTRPKPEDIEAVLSRLSENQIRLFAVDYDAQLREVPNLRRFTNLEYVHLAGRKLVGAKDSRLSAVFPGPLKNLRLIRGNLEILDVSVTGRTMLQGCQKLR